MSANAELVARWFGLRQYEFAARAEEGCPGRVPGAGEVVLVTGASGAGKSVLLRRVVSGARSCCVIDVNAIELPEAPTVDVVGGGTIDRALRLLSLVGLAEAHTYLLLPSALSEGQRFRLRLGVALGRVPARGRVVIVADEFAAVLVRLTACVVARSVRRLTRHAGYSHVGFLLATSHSDLVPALEPDRVIRCDFGVWEEERGGTHQGNQGTKDTKEEGVI